MTSNDHLAEQLRRQADDCMHRRKVLLTCSVALGTTTSAGAAIRALRGWDGPDAIKTAAIKLLDQLTATEQETAP
jgi:hypothetical protein